MMKETGVREPGRIVIVFVLSKEIVKLTYLKFEHFDHFKAYFRIFQNL